MRLRVGRREENIVRKGLVLRGSLWLRTFGGDVVGCGGVLMLW